ERSTVAAALASVAADLTERGQQAGGEAQAVLEAQAMMAQDPGLVDDVNARIESGSTGERAVYEAFAAFQEMLTGLGGYTSARAADHVDVSQLIIAHLRGVAAPVVPTSDMPFVLVAHALAPADTAMLVLAKVFALVTRDVGPSSHT